MTKLHGWSGLEPVLFPLRPARRCLREAHSHPAEHSGGLCRLPAVRIPPRFLPARLGAQLLKPVSTPGSRLCALVQAGPVPAWPARAALEAGRSSSESERMRQGKWRRKATRSSRRVNAESWWEPFCGDSSSKVNQGLRIAKSGNPAQEPSQPFDPILLKELVQPDDEIDASWY
jgi:hypothetical protein